MLRVTEKCVLRRRGTDLLNDTTFFPSGNDKEKKKKRPQIFNSSIPNSEATYQCGGDFSVISPHVFQLHLVWNIMHS